MTTNYGFDVLQHPGTVVLENGNHELSPFDDLPLHSAADVLASTMPLAANWAERFYFNVLRPTGEIVAILGAGIYPGRGIAECYFCRLEGDKQHNVRACQSLNSPDEAAFRAPFSMRCITPMNCWDVAVDIDGGRLLDGRFTAATTPYHYSTVEIPASEPDGPFDQYQHVVAAGRWDIKALQGNDVTSDYHCVRDRTWGLRTRRLRLHNWMVFNVDGVCVNVLHQERGDGSIMFSEGGVAWPDGRTERMHVKRYDFNFDAHTREARAGYFELSGDSGDLRLEYETIGLGIRLNGAGYDAGQGERSSGQQSDVYDLRDGDEARRTGRGTIDIGARVVITGAWQGEGLGVVETAIARDHVRFGDKID